MRSSTSLVGAGVLGAVLAACGGKIVDDPNAGPGEVRPADTGSIAPGPAPAPPRATRPSNEDPCGTICERDGRCGAFQSDCREHCQEQLRGDATCSTAADAYIHCYADNLEPDACTVLPPVCEDAYCAYTRCAGKVVPSYCP